MEPKNKQNSQDNKKLLNQLPNRFQKNNFRPIQPISTKVRSFGGHR